MPSDVGERLVKYCKERADRSLRTIAVLYEEDCEILYLREDLQKKYGPEQYKSVADSFKIEMGMDGHDMVEPPVGDKQVIIHYHERAFVFQFEHDDCHSILMSIEPAVGSQLKSFINECQQRI